MNTPEVLAETLAKIREFARAELIGHQKELDALGEMPLPVYQALAKEGLANWWLPAGRGGLGLSLEDSVDVVSELAYGDAGVAFTSFISILGTTMLTLYGSPGLRDRCLAAMGSGNGFSATLASEAAAGSELAKITTTAARDGGDLVISGRKLFSTNTGFADFLIVLARKSEDHSDHLAIAVPRNSPGVVVERRWDMIGLRASGTYQVTLTDCRVPAENALDGPGLRVLEIGLNASRILIAATAIGIARCVRDMCMEYGKRKSLNNGKLADNQVFGAKLADMEVGITAMRDVCRSAAREFDAVMALPDAAGEFMREGTMKGAIGAKMFCGQTGWHIVSTGSEMFGGLGYTNEMLIGKLMRDMRYVSIVEGGDDVLRELLYRRFVIPKHRRA
jgi:alkylation response protein AidB-like acyl-CoA dehydrogenase